MKYAKFVTQYTKLKAPEKAELERCLAQGASREATMRLFQEARDEARREGFQQGLQQGRREGLLEGIQLVLEIKFGEAGLALTPVIQQIQDPDLMRKIKEALRAAASPEKYVSFWRRLRVIEPRSAGVLTGLPAGRLAFPGSH